MREMSLVSIVSGYGSVFEPVYVTYFDDAHELKSELEKLTLKYNERLRKSSTKMEGYMTKCKVVSVLPISVDDANLFCYNPYTRKRIIAGFDGISRCKLYDASRYTIEGLEKFDKSFKEKYPDYNTNWKYYSLDINETKKALEEEIKSLPYTEEDEYIW